MHNSHEITDSEEYSSRKKFKELVKEKEKEEESVKHGKGVSPVWELMFLSSTLTLLIRSITQHTHEEGPLPSWTPAWSTHDSHNEPS